MTLVRRRFTHFASALRMPSALLLLAVAGGLLFSPSEARAEAYKIVALPNFRPTDINNAGDVVGGFTSFGSDRGAIYRNGTFHGLGEFNPRRLNDVGQIVGDFGDGIGLYQDGVVRYLMPDYAFRSKYYGINNAGDVVGGAFLYHDGAVTRIGPKRPLTFFAGVGINDAGDIAGDIYYDAGDSPDVTAFVSHKGTIQEIYGSSKWYYYSYASAINNSGQVTGFAPFEVEGGEYYDYVEHAFLYTPGSESTLDLGSLGDDYYSWGYGINDRGQVVGYSGPHAFLYQNGEMLDLNNLLPRNSGWELNEAVDINNRGQIIGSGYYRGQPSAFLLTPDAGPQPIPEPATMLLLGTGLTGFGVMIKKRRR